MKIKTKRKEGIGKGREGKGRKEGKKREGRRKRWSEGLESIVKCQDGLKVAALFLP